MNKETTVNLCDTLSCAIVAGPLEHESAAIAGAFSPDGRLLATLTRNGVIHVWDRNTGVPLRPPCPTKVLGFNCIEFSPNSRWLAAFFRRPEVAPSQVALLRLDQPDGRPHILEHRYPVRNARFSPDSEWLVVAAKPDLQLWRTSDLAAAGPPLNVGMSDLIEFSRDGRRLAVCLQGRGGITLLDPGTQRIIRDIPHSFSVAAVSFSQDGRLMASADWDSNLHIWDTEPVVNLRYTLQFGSRLRSLAFSPDDSLLAIAEVRGKVHVLRVRDRHLTHALQGNFWNPMLSFLTNGIVASDGNFWDPFATALSGSPLPDDALASAVAFDRSGNVLAVGGAGELRLWTMQPSPVLVRVVAMPGPVKAITYSESERRFVAFTGDGSITLVDPQTGNTALRSHCDRGYDSSARFSPDGRELAVLAQGELYRVNTRTGQTRYPNTPNAGARSVDFSGDSRRLFAGFANWDLRSYDLASTTNGVIIYGKMEGWIEGVACHPGGKVVALCVSKRALWLLDLAKREEIGPASATSVRADHLVFSRDGTLLAVAGALPGGGYAVELWHVDLQHGFFFSGVLLPHDHPVWSMTFSPDDQTLVVGGQGTTRLWRLPGRPKDFKEIQSQTLATFGKGLDAQGHEVFAEFPESASQEIRARISRPREPLPPLDLALKRPPVEALEALRQLASQHPERKIYTQLLARQHAGLVTDAAEKGRWNQALDHVTEAIRLGHDDPRAFYHRALISLAAGDTAGYRAACRAMMAAHGSSFDPDVLSWVAWTVALRRDALDDYADLLGRLRSRTLQVRGFHAPAYRFYLAAVLARAGRYEEAVAEFEKVDRHLSEKGADVNFSPLYYKFLLSICHAHLGHEEEARYWFGTAARDVQNLLQQQGEDAPPASTVSWNRRLTLELLQKEAWSPLIPEAPDSDTN